MQHEDEKAGLLPLTTKLLLRLLDVLLELTHGVLEGGTGVIDLINNEDILANQVGHLQGAHIQPLRTSDFGTGDFFSIATTQIFVEGETDRLNGDVGVTGALEERSWKRSVRTTGAHLKLTYRRMRAGT